MDSDLSNVLGYIALIILFVLASGFVSVLVRMPKVGQGKNMNLLEPSDGSNNV